MWFVALETVSVLHKAPIAAVELTLVMTDKAFVDLLMLGWVAECTVLL